MSFKGKTIALTGGSGGLGELVAHLLSCHGGKVLVTDRVAPNSASLPYATGDLSTIDGIEAVAARIAAAAPDILVNLAGIQYFGPFPQQSSASIFANYMVNLVAPVMLTQAVLSGMQLRGSGHIVNIGSIFGSINYPHFVTYSSAKAGLRGFSEALRRELQGSGIDVTYIAPRAVKTALHDDAVMRFTAMAKMNLDTPQDVAKKIVRAIIDRKKDLFIGFPERFFVRVNAIAPRLVDAVMSAETTRAKTIFTT